MTTPISIRWPEGAREFPGDRTVTIGRSRDCDVVLDNDVISRRHGSLVPGPEGWHYVDEGSSRGTWVNGDRVSRHDVRGLTTLVLGEGPDAVRLEVEPGAAASSDPAEARTQLPRTALSSADPAVSAGGASAGGASAGGAPQTVLAHQRLTVESEGKTQHFYPGQVVRLGREDAEVVLSEPSVSRRHASISHDGQAWVLRDEGSAHGTHLAGQRVTEMRLQGRTELVLGSPDVGPRVVLVAGATGGVAAGALAGGGAAAAGAAAGATAGAAAAGAPPSTWQPPAGAASGSAQQDETRGRGPKTAALVAGAVAAVVAVAVGAAFLTGVLGGDDEARGQLDRDALARATVRVVLDSGSGSGTIIDAERGLILTNAHVAAPRAQGAAVNYGRPSSELPEESSTIRIAVAPGLDRSAEMRFVAELVVADGYLDLAVLRIVETTSGALVTPADLAELTAVELGDSESLSTGETVHVLGYPGIAASAASSLTRGVISGTVPDRRLDTNRAFLNFDASIAGGVSGGLAADDAGRLIGIPSLSRLPDDPTDPVDISSMRPINLAKPLVDAARGDGTYEPEHMISSWPDDAEVAGLDFLAPAREGFASSCDAATTDPEAGDGGVAVALDYEGFPAADHQDVLVRLLSAPLVTGGGLGPTGPGDVTEPGSGAEPAQWQLAGQVRTNDYYPVPTSENGCLTATIAVEDGLTAGNAYRLELFGGPSYEPLGSHVFRVQ